MILDTVKDAFSVVQDTIDKQSASVNVEEISTVSSVSGGTAEVSRLDNVQMEELLMFPNDVMGLAFTLAENSVGVVFLNNPDDVKAGDRVYRTGRVVDVPVGDRLLGRVIDPLGNPLDGAGRIVTVNRRKIEREAYPIMARAPVAVPLQTGIKAIDSFTPIGRGQRELILGDRQTGKTALAVDAIINQKNTGVICIYCAIAQRGTAIARVVDNLKKYDVMKNTIVVAASGDETAGMQYIAPYAATAIGEYFMEKGKDVLVVYDDLTAHARAYRELSLLLRRHLLHSFAAAGTFDALETRIRRRLFDGFADCGNRSAKYVRVHSDEHHFHYGRTDLFVFADVPKRHSARHRHGAFGVPRGRRRSAARVQRFGGTVEAGFFAVRGIGKLCKIPFALGRGNGTSAQTRTRHSRRHAAKAVCARSRGRTNRDFVRDDRRLAGQCGGRYARKSVQSHRVADENKAQGHDGRDSAP